MDEKNLKELLKPPFFVCKDGIVIDKDGWVLFKIGSPPILEEAGFNDWITAAMNEKHKRDYTSHGKWIKEGFDYVCPKCGSSYVIAFNFCPHCGDQKRGTEDERFS